MALHAAVTHPVQKITLARGEGNAAVAELMQDLRNRPAGYQTFTAAPAEQHEEYPDNSSFKFSWQGQVGNGGNAWLIHGMIHVYVDGQTGLTSMQVSGRLLVKNMAGLEWVNGELINPVTAVFEYSGEGVEGALVGPIKNLLALRALRALGGKDGWDTPGTECDTEEVFLAS